MNDVIDAAQTPNRFALTTATDTEIPLGGLRDVKGFFAAQDDAYADFEDATGEPEPRMSFTATGFRPADPSLLSAEGGANPVELGDVYLEILGDGESPIGDYWVGAMTLEGLTPDGTGTFDASFTGWLTSRPDRDAGRLWDLWRSGPPSEKNVWAHELPPGRREAWVEVISHCMPKNPRATPRDPGDDVVVMDGRYITDLASFFCAVGEAVNGPGGYFGSSLMGFTDCLRGGWGIDGPFTLVWEDSATAQNWLARRVERDAGSESYMELILGCLRHVGNTVVLD
ncbi:hypothetical protein [Streptomyces sp. NPDC058434]|uniref:barstar family protein n=1 Tax=Streptomyces sp. NPDC058434 TaxID=3346498 RepID=UPI0036504D83